MRNWQANSSAATVSANRNNVITGGLRVERPTVRSKRRRSVFIRATCFCLQLNAFFCFQRCRCREVRLHASCMTGFIDGLFPPLFVTECNCPVKKEKKKKKPIITFSCYNPCAAVFLQLFLSDLAYKQCLPLFGCTALCHRQLSAIMDGQFQSTFNFLFHIPYPFLYCHHLTPQAGQIRQLS